MQVDKPSGGAVAGARAQLDALRSFVVAHHLVSVPNDQQAQVAEAPPYNRSNGAYISIPGPYEKGVAYTYYIAPPDPSWSAAERAAYIQGKASQLYTSVHEVWPQQPGASSAPDPRTYWQAFHDRFLSYGGPPIPLLRRAMVGEGGSLL
jgi:hypothetical protein